MHIVGFSDILSWRGHWIAKLITEYRAEELTRAIAPYVALKEVAHEMVCLSKYCFLQQITAKC